MPKASTSIVINRSCEDVFDIIHDYENRLAWDTLLRKAYLLNGAKAAGKGVRSVCAGKWLVGGLALETEYISFTRGKVAAIKLTNNPPFFEKFAATLKHDKLANNQSRVTYTYNFKSKPRQLKWFLEPIMNFFFYRETKMRLNALKRHLEKESK